jgi:CHAT domain-containing protein/predicted negative regulator of RcsB-dependent stress response
LLEALLAATLSAQRLPDPALMAEYNRARILLGERREAEALDILKGIIAKDKTFHRACSLFGERAQTMAAERERTLRGILERDPGNACARYGLAWMARDPERAAVEARACVNTDPGFVPCYMHLFPGNSSGLPPEKVRTLARAHRALLLDLLKRHPELPGPRAGLGVAAMAGSHYGEARQHFLSAVNLARAAGDVDHEAFLLNRVPGLTGNPRTNPPELVRRALALQEQLGDHFGRIETLGDLGATYGYMGNHEEALRYANLAVRLAREGKDSSIEAATLLRLGSVQSELGLIEPALESLAASIAIYRDRGWPGEEERPLRTRAEVLVAAGRYDEALEAFHTARELARQRKDGYNEAFNLRGIGTVYEQRGDYLRSLDYHVQSVRLFNQVKQLHPAGAGLGMIGDLYLKLGDYPRAREHYQRSLATATTFNDPSEQQHLLFNLGKLHLENQQPLVARRYFLKAVGLAPLVRFWPWAVHSWIGLGQSRARLGERHTAMEDLRRALDLSRQTGWKALEGAALVALGETQLGGGEVSAAQEQFQRAAEIAAHFRIAELGWQSSLGLGKTAELAGDDRQALERFRRAVEEIESARGRVQVAEYKAGFLGARLEAYDRLVAGLARLHEDREAFHYSERRRARAFLDTLAAGSPAALTEEQSRRQEQLVARVSRATSRLLTQDSPASRDALQQAEDELIEFHAELRRLYHQAVAPEILTAGEVQARLLDEGDALVEYALGEERSFAWLITPRSVAMYPLPGRSRIERLVADYRASVGRHPQGDAGIETWQRQAQALNRVLLAPLEKDLAGVRRLLIVPDGLLHYLPFETLGRSLDDFAIAYAPSASALGLLRSRTGAAASKDLLAFGDPALPGTPSAVRSAYGTRGFRFGPLPSARQEVRAIAGLYPPAGRKLYVGAAATEASLKKEAVWQYRRLHFATHAFLDERFAAASGILLAPTGTTGEDGVVQLNEILGLRLNADLVTLSACQTALGKLTSGEGLVGLSRAFLSAGASRLVVSLWEVNDVATAELMKSFYRRMRAGADPAEALRQAKREMRRSPTRAYRHPYFWAPFVVIGAP